MKSFLVLAAAILFLAPKALAAENEFVTVVNPVRVSTYTKDVAASLKSQYSVVSQNAIPATWLLTYDVLNTDTALPVLKSMRGQEFGIWLEVTRESSKNVGIEFHETGSWHHADAVFLAGYTREERIKFIDAVFEKFKTKLGYYPTSVGSWWTDAYSLGYMKEKYRISANLGVSDQFSTDNYQVWGQYWSLPFYPSKYNPAMPAVNKENKLDIVNLQWAPRDPLNGYKSSLYSTQDYGLQNLDINYFEKLVMLFGKKGKNEFGQITVGLEGDFAPETYKGEYSKQMSLVSRLAAYGEFSLRTMKEFSDWYRKKYPEVSPPAVVETENAVWYQSPRYRIGFVFDAVEDEVKIIDLRVYSSDFLEPYFFSPVGEKTLFAYNPSVLDEGGLLKTSWKLPPSKTFETSGTNKNFSIFLDNLQISLTPGKFTLAGQDPKTPSFVVKNNSINSSVNGQTYTFEPRSAWLAPLGGVLVKGITPEFSHFLGSKKLKLTGLLLLATLLVFIVKLAKTKRLKIYLKVPIIIFALTFPFPVTQSWKAQHLTNYLIVPAEVDALNQLSLLPKGKVVVVDGECLQCVYHTEYKPPAFANQRSYVENLTGQEIVPNSSIFNASTREKAYAEVKKTNAKYAYLVKFEKYIEKLPFSPGDLKADLIYENANAQIWRLN
ncbi:MAG: hypothetical protein Q7S79_02725 [bacterium]|nr:hypothetical protein [bacterium]